MTYEEVAQKFRNCAGFARWPADKIERIVETVGSMERLDNVKRLTELLGK